MNPMRLFFVPILVILTLLAGCSKGDGPIAPSSTDGPIARFTHSAPDGYVAGEAINFDASSSTSEFFKITEFTWDWGDGSDPETFDIPTASHIFSDPAGFEVTLTVQDQVGRVASIKTAVDIIPQGEAPTAQFTYEAPEGWQPGSELFFDASRSTDPDGDELTYIWNWGDGQISDPMTTPEASHVFNSEGEIEVTLRVRDSAGWETVSDPLRMSFGYPIGPPIIGSIDFATGSNAKAVAVQGELAYVACGYGGMRIIDISNPTDPQIAGHLMDPDADFIDVSGNLAVIVDNNERVQAIDISDPGNPTLKGHIPLDYDHMDIILNGHNVYINESYGIHIADFSDPDTPKDIAYIEKDPDTYKIISISADENHLCILEGGNIRIFDITDPANPTLAGTYTDPPESLRSVLVDGSYMYITMKYDLFGVVDIRDPSNPTVLGTCNAYNTRKITKSDDTVIVSEEKIDFIDVSDPASPKVIASGVSLWSPYAIEASTNYLYIADFSNGLTIMDYSIMTGPVVISTLDEIELGEISCTRDTVLKGNYAYISYELTYQSNGLLIVDLHDKLNPRIVHNIPFECDISEIVLAGDNLFLVDHYDALLAFDLSDRTNPIPIGEIEVPDINDVVVSGNYAYATGCNHMSLAVIDLHDLQNMEIIASMDLFLRSKTIDIKDDYVYLGGLECAPGYYWNLVVVDVSDPANPVEGAAILIDDNTGLGINDMTVSGDLLCILLNPHISGGNGTLKVVDISNPSSPFIAGETHTKSDADDMQVFGRYAYLGGDGLTVIDFTDPSMPEIGCYAGGPGHYSFVGVEGNHAVTTSGNSHEEPSLSVIELW